MVDLAEGCCLGCCSSFAFGKVYFCDTEDLHMWLTYIFGVKGILNILIDNHTDSFFCSTLMRATYFSKVATVTTNCFFSRESRLAWTWVLLHNQHKEAVASRLFRSVDQGEQRHSRVGWAGCLLGERWIGGGTDRGDDRHWGTGEPRNQEAPWTRTTLQHPERLWNLKATPIWTPQLIFNRGWIGGFWRVCLGFWWLWLAWVNPQPAGVTPRAYP